MGEHWLQRRVSLVLSDPYHAITLVSVWAPVRWKDLGVMSGLPVIECPLDALVADAKRKRPDLFEERDFVGALFADDTKINAGKIVWLENSGEEEVKVQPGADKILHSPENPCRKRRGRPRKEAA